jgi:eukaryotic translation initiation factor 2C
MLTRVQMITDLAEMMVERLQHFQKSNQKKLPERILVYRDGVSEVCPTSVSSVSPRSNLLQGQFATVLLEEVPLIRAACKKFDTASRPYRPELTVVVCGKRHHTRFYPTEAQNADHAGNPRPGTVVDRGITAIYDFDFYLQAHGGLVGTTRPTHYYVICNEMGLDADGLQTLTNNVSYTFARATKAVSLVSPAYYADLACERGRCYIHKLLQGFSSSGTTSASGESALDGVWREAEKLWHGGVTGRQQEIMFYL